MKKNGLPWMPECEKPAWRLQMEAAKRKERLRAHAQAEAAKLDFDKLLEETRHPKPVAPKRIMSLGFLKRLVGSLRGKAN